MYAEEEEEEDDDDDYLSFIWCSIRNKINNHSAFCSGQIRGKGFSSTKEAQSFFTQRAPFDEKFGIFHPNTIRQIQLGRLEGV